MATRRARGDAAEDRVHRAAEARGWRLLARNYTIRGGELDLVYLDAEHVVIVEVRYRARADYGSAAASVTATKQRRIVRAARHLLAFDARCGDRPFRFDVVGVDDGPELDWIENAFYAE